MIRSRVVLPAVALVITVGLLLSGCTQRSNQDVAASDATPVADTFPDTPDQPTVPGRPGGTFRLGIVEPTAIDPYNSQESEGFLVTKALFTGLVQVRRNGDAYDGVASAWTPNADCTQWTFTLKPGGQPMVVQSRAQYFPPVANSWQMSWLAAEHSASWLHGVQS